MNQDQRKFLITQVQQTYKSQVDDLEKQIPIKPSLNNYLVAAFLDGSIKFNDIDALKSKMRESVLRYGVEDRLVTESDEYHYRRSNKIKDKNIVNVIAEDLFVIPKNYLDALAEYNAKKEEIENQINNLKATLRTIEMKIQIGSSSTMDKIVMQVDSMGDLNLLNTQLILGDGK